jgi:hypothetical protein
MSVVWALRRLSRVKALVVLAAVIAVFVGLSMSYRISTAGLQARQYEVGIASASALVDTTNSQVVDLGDGQTNSAGSLPGRAMLLARLLASSPLKDEIAQRAGVRPDMLIGIAGTPGAAAADAAESAPTGAAVKADDPRANVLTVGTAESLPLLTVETQAPSARTAARLSDEAISVLVRHLDSLAGASRVPSDRRLVVKQLGTARVATETRGPSRILAIVAALFVFALLCGLILLVAALLDGLRQADGTEHEDPVAVDSDLEALMDDELSFPEFEQLPRA